MNFKSLIHWTKNKIRDQKDNLWNGEKIFANAVTKKGLICKIYKEPIQLTNNNHNKKTVKKRAEDLIDISPKKTYRWPTGTWKDAQHH